MKTTNVAEFKKHLSSFLALVEKGDTVEIHRRNLPIARVVALPAKKKNRTVLGCGKGSITFHGSVTEPLILAEHWEMLADQSSKP